MNNRRNNERKRIKGLIATLMVLLVAIGICFAVPGIDSFAAGGTVIVSVPTIDDKDFKETGFEGFTFRVYKVGHYNGPDFELDSKYAELGVTLPSGDKETPEFQENWMKAARSLAAQMKTLDPAPSPADNGTFEKVMPGNSFEFSSQENALYLVVADPAVSDKFSWTPVPVFIRTLNGRETFSYESSDTMIKIDKDQVVFEYTVAKLWDDNDNKTGARPDSVKVAIYYGDKRVDVVTLDESGWTYTWKAEKKGESYNYVPQTEGKGKAVNGISINASSDWSVAELTKSENGIEVSPNMKYYKADVPEKALNGAFLITNKLSTKTIKLTKNIDGFDADCQNLTFSFRIDGYRLGEDGKPEGDPIWTNHAGISFTGKDDLGKETVIEFVPEEVEYITVTEEYSANYTPDPDKPTKIEYVDGIWTVTMYNKHDDHGPKGGVVNKYENGKQPAQQGLEEPKQ